MKTCGQGQGHGTARKFSPFLTHRSQCLWGKWCPWSHPTFLSPYPQGRQTCKSMVFMPLNYIPWLEFNSRCIPQGFQSNSSAPSHLPLISVISVARPAHRYCGPRLWEAGRAKLSPPILTVGEEETKGGRASPQYYPTWSDFQANRLSNPFLRGSLTSFLQKLWFET